ncbi:MAG: hypothetical protein K0V04_02005 [Deltaproteobacteria bacterium]|nr:hypothetical protein [Deltaproteobacteria bacterium]
MRIAATGWIAVVLVASCKPATTLQDPGPAVRETPSDDEATETPAVPATVALLERLRAADRDHGASRYILANYYARLGDREATLTQLRELEAIEGWDYPLSDDDLRGFADDPEVVAIAASLRARAPTLTHGPVAFELDAIDIMPEGVAWDPRRARLLVGSTAQRQILVSTTAGVTRPLVAPAQAGLLGVLGLAVDARRDQVFAASVAISWMEGFDVAIHEGSSMIHAFDLATGDTLGRWFAPDPRAQINDLIVLSNETVLATDSINGTVLRKAPRGLPNSVLEMLVPRDTFTSPNGIVALPGESAIAVADFDGLHRVELRDGAISPLTVPPGVHTLGGIDGLDRHDDTLIGIQNLLGPGRVWALQLAPDGRSLTRGTILDADHPRYMGPTTGAIAGDRFLYLGNASLQMGPRGVRPAQDGQRHVILELPLGDDRPAARD